MKKTSQELTAKRFKLANQKRDGGMDLKEACAFAEIPLATYNSRAVRLRKQGIQFQNLSEEPKKKKKYKKREPKLITLPELTAYQVPEKLVAVAIVKMPYSQFVEHFLE